MIGYFRPLDPDHHRRAQQFVEQRHDMPNRVLIAVSDAAERRVYNCKYGFWRFYLSTEHCRRRNTASSRLSSIASIITLSISAETFGRCQRHFLPARPPSSCAKSSILNGGPIVVTAFRD